MGAGQIGLTSRPEVPFTLLAITLGGVNLKQIAAIYILLLTGGCSTTTEQSLQEHVNGQLN